MKINIDNEHTIEISELQEKVIKHFIFDEEFKDDMIRRIDEAITGKYLNCFRRLKEEWDPRLEESGLTMLPTNKDEYAKLVFSQPNYKSRSKRDERT